MKPIKRISIEIASIAAMTLTACVNPIPQQGDTTSQNTPDAPAPEIEIVALDASTTPITDGATYPFGDVVTMSSKEVVFQITNNGTAELDLSGDTLVTMSGDVDAFILTAPPSSAAILPGASETFTIAFSPTAIGSKQVTGSIQSNASGSTYTFIITGNGIGSWKTVGTSGFSAGQADYLSLAFDGAGTPYVAYVDQSLSPAGPVVDGLSSGAWEALGTHPSWGFGPVYYTSLTISGGTPYLAYTFDGDGYALGAENYTTKADWDRFLSTFYGATPYHKYISIQVDAASGIQYIGFQDNTSNGAGKAAVLTYSATSYNAIDVSDGSASFESLALYSGVPYLAYKDESRTALGRATVMYYDAKSQGWLPAGTAGFTAGTADWTSLAIDSSGNLLLAFSDGSQAGKATVMEYFGSGWSVVGTAGFSDGAASSISLALDSDGSPCVAYVDGGNSGRLTVKTWNGSSWTNVGPAGFTAGAASHVSLGVFSHVPFVAFQDGANGGKATVAQFK